MQPRNRILLVLIFFLVGVAFLETGCKRDEDERFKIGVLLPLSGDSAAYGIDCRDGAQLAFAHAKDIKVIYEDSKEDPATTLTAFRKLSSIDGIDALLGSMFSITSLPLAPVAQRAKVVMLTPASSDAAVPLAGDCIFSLYPSAQTEGELVAEAVTKSKVKEIVVLYQNVKAALDLSTALANRLTETKLVRTHMEALPDQALDYPALINKLGNPEAIFICAYKDPLLRFIAKAKELGVTARWFSQSTLYEPAAIKEHAADLEGIVFTAPYFNDLSTNTKVSDFRKDYRTAYGREPTVWSAFGYDGASILLKAHQRMVIAQTNDFKSILSHTTLKGVTGPTSFDAQRRPIKSMVILQVKNGVPETADF